jgi:hypothetical protein
MATAFGTWYNKVDRAASTCHKQNGFDIVHQIAVTNYFPAYESSYPQKTLPKVTRSTKMIDLRGDLTRDLIATLISLTKDVGYVLETD